MGHTETAISEAFLWIYANGFNEGTNIKSQCCYKTFTMSNIKFFHITSTEIYYKTFFVFQCTQSSPKLFNIKQNIIYGTSEMAHIYLYINIQ